MRKRWKNIKGNGNKVLQNKLGTNKNRTPDEKNDRLSILKQENYAVSGKRR